MAILVLRYSSVKSQVRESSVSMGSGRVMAAFRVGNSPNRRRWWKNHLSQVGRVNWHGDLIADH